ncbi:tetratricopeptide repeat protein [Planctomycetota bacterium]
MLHTVLILMGLFCPHVSAVAPQDAIVVIEVHGPKDGGYGYGVVTGDGSYVVCLFHLAHEASFAGPHRLRRLLKVISPYLGEAVEASYVGHDTNQSLSLLQVPWRGHPALPLADTRRLLDCERAILIGLPTLIGVPLRETIDTSLGIFFNKTNLPIDYLKLRRGIPQSLAVQPQGLNIARWQGVPLVSPDGSHLLAITQAYHTKTKRLAGPSVVGLEGVLAAHLSGERELQSTAAGHPEGMTIMRQHILSMRLVSSGHFNEAQAAARYVIEQHEECPHSHSLLAQIHAEQGQYETAETHFQQALSLSSSVLVRDHYLRFLINRKRYQDARAALSPLWEDQTLRPYLSLYAFMSLKDQPQTCIEHLQEASEVDPNCMYPWLYLGMVHYQQAVYDKAIQAHTKAVSLYPEDSMARDLLINDLHEAGGFQEAAHQYRQRIRFEPDNSIVYLRFAKFLSAHKPDATQEALGLARKALQLPEQDNLSHAEIKRVLKRIEAHEITCDSVREADH